MRKVRMRMTELVVISARLWPQLKSVCRQHPQQESTYARAPSLERGDANKRSRSWSISSCTCFTSTWKDAVLFGKR